MGVFLKSRRENGTSQGSSEAEAQEVKKRALGAAEAESRERWMLTLTLTVAQMQDRVKTDNQEEHTDAPNLL